MDRNQHKAFTRNQSIALVFCCTILGAAAQFFMKTGMTLLPAHPNLLQVLMNFRIMGGFSLYGINTVLLIFALRDGELSVLYPAIALTYVWVTMISALVFHESVNVLKVFGVTVIVIGVAVLGRETKR